MRRYDDFVLYMTPRQLDLYRLLARSRFNALVNGLRRRIRPAR